MFTELKRAKEELRLKKKLEEALVKLLTGQGLPELEL
jgi:hypothetical protein